MISMQADEGKKQDIGVVKHILTSCNYRPQTKENAASQTTGFKPS